MSSVGAAAYLSNHTPLRLMLRLAVPAVWTLAPVLAGCAPHSVTSPAQGLRDLSGLAWVEGDDFLVVHDAKADDEPTLRRVSIVTAPRAGHLLRWTPLDVDWQAAGALSHDLESVARVPGTDTYLLAESGDDGSAFRRVFVTTLAGASLVVREVAAWPVEVVNVEAIAVAQVGEAPYFVFAERAHGEPATRFVWARLRLDPFSLSDVRAVTFPHPGLPGPDSRPIAALDVDSAGIVYVASAEDADRDDGPFRSAVWRVGRFVADDAGADLVLDPAPTRLATLDGLKVECLAVRERGGRVEVFVGTDDENWGGVLRMLPGEAPVAAGGDG